jgi:hypothetical protein
LCGVSVKLKLAAQIATFITLVGCASTVSEVKLSEVRDSVPRLKAGRGRVYFYTSMNLGISNPEIHVNDAFIGHVKGGTVFFVDLRPGHYTVDAGGDMDQADFTLDTGDTRYVKFGRTVALIGSMAPEVVSRSQGQDEIQDLSFDEDRRYQLVYPLRDPASTQE